MKRLVRKAEIAGAIYNRENKYIEVYKNPSRTEFERCQKQNEYNSVRMYIDLDGNVYVWDMEGLHDEVMYDLNFEKGFKCELTDNVFEISIGPMYNLKENFRDAFVSAKGILDSIGISNLPIRWDSFLNGIDGRFIKDLTTVNDIYNISL